MPIVTTTERCSSCNTYSCTVSYNYRADTVDGMCLFCGFGYYDTPRSYDEFAPGLVVRISHKDSFDQIVATTLTLGKLVAELRKQKVKKATIVCVQRPALSKRPALAKRYVFAKNKIRQVHTFTVAATGSYL